MIHETIRLVVLFGLHKRDIYAYIYLHRYLEKKLQLRNVSTFVFISYTYVITDEDESRNL